MYQDQTDDFFTVQNRLKPFPAMDDGWSNGWRTVARKLHPYDEDVYSDQGNSVIAMLLPTFTGDSMQADSLYTVYLSRPGTMSPSKAKDDLGVLAAGIHVPSERSASGEVPAAQ